MAEKKSYIYEIIIDTRSGIASLNGTDVALTKLESKLRQVQKETVMLNKGLKDTSDVSGLASAATVELGRTFGDAGYGIQGVTNNVQQLGTLFTTLIGRTGKTGISGVRAALDLMGKSLWGPLGIIVAFQALTAAIEWFSRRTREAKEEFIDFEKVLTDKLVNLDHLGRWAVNSEDALSALRKEFKELDEFLGSVDESQMAPQVIEEAVKRMESLLKVRTDILIKNKEIENNEQDTYSNRKLYIKQQEELRDLMIEEARLTALLTALKKNDVVVEGEKFDDDFEGKKERQKKAIIVTQAEIREWEFEEQMKSLQQYEDHKQAELDVTRKFNEEIKKTEEERFKHKLMMLDGMGEGLQALGYLLGEATQEGKAIAAAGALIDTYAAIAKTLKAFAGVPIPGYAIAQSIGIGLAGFAQVKKIYSVNVPKGGSGGGAAGGVPSEVPIQQPDFNIVGVARQNQLRETIDGALGRPIRAYVTTRDIRSGEELDRNIVRGASVG